MPVANYSLLTIPAEYGLTALSGADIEVYTLYHLLGSAGSNMLRTLDRVVYPNVGDLDVVDAREIESDDPELEQIGTPKRAALVREKKGTAIFLHPIPDAIGNVIIWGVVMPTNLSTDTTYSDLPEEYHALWEAVSRVDVLKAHGKSPEKLQMALDDLRTEMEALGLQEEPEVDYLLKHAEEPSIWDTSGKEID